jgi:hypothetical protein
MGWPIIWVNSETRLAAGSTCEFRVTLVNVTVTLAARLVPCVGPSRRVGAGLELQPDADDAPPPDAAPKPRNADLFTDDSFVPPPAAPAPAAPPAAAAAPDVLFSSSESESESESGCVLRCVWSYRDHFWTA